MAKLVKLADIAARVGVSTVTVSKALSGKEGMSDKVREQIKQVAEELGYMQPSAIREEQKAGTGYIGVIIPTHFMRGNTSYYWYVYQLIARHLGSKGFYCILELLEEDAIAEKRIPGMIADNKVDGIIMVGQTDEAYADFIWERAGKRAMYLDFYDKKMVYDTVISDGFIGMYSLVSYLIDEGCTRIGFVGKPYSTSSITDRYFGYCKALCEHDIAPREDWIISDRGAGLAMSQDIQLPDELPEAFACSCDVVAMSVIRLLEERGVAVPEDILITGYDDYLYIDSKESEITTCSVNIDKMTELCIKTLLRKLERKDYQMGIQVVAGKLELRKSTWREKGYVKK